MFLYWTDFRTLYIICQHIFIIVLWYPRNIVYFADGKSHQFSYNQSITITQSHYHCYFHRVESLYLFSILLDMLSVSQYLSSDGISREMAFFHASGIPESASLHIVAGVHCIPFSDTALKLFLFHFTGFNCQLYGGSVMTWNPLSQTISAIS
jgi:hypothetical protein